MDYLLTLFPCHGNPRVFSMSHLILTLLQLLQYNDAFTLTIISHALILLEYFQQHKTSACQEVNGLIILLKI